MIEFFIILSLRTHALLVLLVAVVYVIERLTGLLLLVGWFKHVKDNRAAVGTADREAVIYFIFCLGYYLYYSSYKVAPPADYSFLYWLMIYIPLTLLLRKIYFRFQGEKYIDWWNDNWDKKWSPQNQ